MAGMLEGKVALITGGGRGIGRQTALLFAREGASVVVADLSADGAKETVGLIERAGGQATSLIADVAKPDDITAMVARTVETYGRLDCAFNNDRGARVRAGDPRQLCRPGTHRCHPVSPIHRMARWPVSPGRAASSCP